MTGLLASAQPLPQTYSVHTPRHDPKQTLMVIQPQRTPGNRRLSQAKAFPSSRTCLKLNIDRTQQPLSLHGCQADLSHVSHMKPMQDFPSMQAGSSGLSAIVHDLPQAARGIQLQV